MSFRSIPGSLFKEILKFSETDDLEVITRDSKLPIDLILQNSDEKLMFGYNSTSSVGSDSDDPVYDDTLLQDLFYANEVSKATDIVYTVAAYKYMHVLFSSHGTVYNNGTGPFFRFNLVCLSWRMNQGMLTMTLMKVTRRRK